MRNEVHDLDAYGSELLQRIAGTVAIMLYEMKIWPDGTLECLTFVGLEALIGPVPEGMTADGAYDAAVHPDDREAYDATGEALARGESVEIEYRLLGHDGQTRWVLDRMRPEGAAEDGSLLVDGVVADITARKRIEAEAIEKLAHAALRDSLTGLANRTAFLEHLDAALARASRTGEGAAVLFIDLDNFKLVNDSFGHHVGDGVLVEVGQILRRYARRTDPVARVGGEEFALVVAGTGPEALVLAERLRERVRAALAERHPGLTISFGIASYPHDGQTVERLMRAADEALYAAKALGRDRAVVHSRETSRALSSTPS